MTSRRSISKALIAALEQIAVPFSPEERARYEAWQERRRRAVILQAAAALRLDGNWLAPLVRRWHELAAAVGWKPETSVDYRGGACPHEDLDLLRHISGVEIDVHLHAETSPDGAVTLRTSRCPRWTGLRIEMNLDRDLALTAEEAASGAGCRSCGRPWVVTQDMLETGLDVEAGNLEFWEAHSDCESPRMGFGSSGIEHCLRCCPLPQPSPAVASAVNRELRRGQKEVLRRRLEERTRWDRAGEP